MSVCLPGSEALIICRVGQGGGEMSTTQPERDLRWTTEVCYLGIQSL